jgi:hypothetical protein
MVQEAVQKESGVHGGAERGRRKSGSGEQSSTQSTQYDAIGTKYLEIKTLPAAEPEIPSILAALGENGVKGKKCLGAC